MADKKQLKIGVFLPSTSGVQLLDLATVDVLAMMSQEYLSLLSSMSFLINTTSGIGETRVKQTNKTLLQKQ